MKNLVRSSDNNPFTRWLLIPYIIRLFHLSASKKQQNPEFAYPRFNPFRSISYSKSKFIRWIHSYGQNKAYRLFIALVQAHRFQIIIGLLTCLLWTVFNTLTPKIVKQFFALMKDTKLEGQEIERANYLTEKFVLLQILRILASANTKRLFGQLSIKVNGALSIELTKKALKLSHKCRYLLPQAQIYQLQNTDMKAVSKLFKELWVITDIPITIIAAIIYLFFQGGSFGVVGIYWVFLIIFLQRWLEDLMERSMTRKLRLTEKRSRNNYELIQKMPEARIDMSQEYLIESNNNFFISELKEYHIFHRLQSIFDISQILLPLVIVISLAFYDLNERQNFTIEEVYILMSLIGLIYKPLKNLKKYTLTFKEGMYSLQRFGLYLNLPEQRHTNEILNDDSLAPKLMIQENTSTINRLEDHMKFQCNFVYEIKLFFGQRLFFLSRHEHQISQFIKSIVDELQTISGSIRLEGSIAYLPRQLNFSDESIANNISFYDKTISEDRIQYFYKKLGLDSDLQLREGLSEKVRMKNFTYIELKKIALARALCSDRKVIILDCPFEGLSSLVSESLELILRERQAKGSMIIIGETEINYGRNDDNLAIIEDGQIKEYDKYQTLYQNSSLLKSFRLKRSYSLSERIVTFNILKEFQKKLTNSFQESSNEEEENKKKQKQQLLQYVLKVFGKYSMKMKNTAESKKVKKGNSGKKPYTVYVKHVLKYLPFGDWFWAVASILVIELLNIFIQYQFGNEYKHGGKQKLSSLKGIMRFELILTILLACFIFIQKQIEFSISYIIGNHIYKNSLEGMTKKKMSWYYKNSAHLTAHKFNKDYDEVVTCVKYIFDIIKFFIVLITTILSIDTTAKNVLVLTVVTSSLYYALMKFFRNAEQTLVKCYPVYKHEFVKVFDQVVEGAHLITIYNKQIEAVNKAKIGFVNLSAYKLTSQTTQITEEALCQLAGTFIISLGLQLGTKAKIMKGDQNEAMIAVSVMLLLNLSDVLKNLMKTFLKLQTFFRLKLLSFIELIDLKPNKQNHKESEPSTFDVSFKQRMVQNPDDPVFELYPISLQIPFEQKLLVLEKDSLVRKNIMMVLTNNLQDQSQYNKHVQINVIRIGDKLIKNIDKHNLRYIVGTLLPDNFYFSGTLKQNLQWRSKKINATELVRIVKMVNLQKQLPSISKQGVNVKINAQKKKLELGRKIALLKILVRRPKIVIVKDTSWIIDGKSILEYFRQQHLFCTVIGISQIPSGTKETEKVILMQKGKILEQGSVQQLEDDPLSQAGQMLRNQSECEDEYQPIIQQLKKRISTRDLIRSIIETHEIKDLELQ